MNPTATATPSAPTAPASPAAAFTLDDFDFELPPDLIAQHPTPERSASRLLDGRAAGTALRDRSFRELPALLNEGDLLVFNDTRVIKARLFGHKASGGAVEVLVERVLAGTHEVHAHVRASKSPKPGARLSLGGDRGEPFEAEVLGRAGIGGELFHLRFPADPFALLQQHGHVPLPPYITHADGSDDERRYQTVFARHPGAVAAPTAALHFDEALLAALAQRGVQRASITLHVGAGTFLPVRVNKLAEHRMHSEWFEVSAETVAAIEATRVRGGRVVAVGTTTLRALESAVQRASAGQADQTNHARQASHGAHTLAPYRGDTDIFITPGFAFRVADALVTNFHLPRSTLMMLVTAFAGHAHVMALYRHAVAARYRFFSYGDSMLLERTPC